ncbi:hypothetical protein NDU88_001253 [Pleurodeles waltl]|uniref:Uncharacterized protein n=1 Tax=Pleurodeles waltl TaxID=8319 RepID=A0AAV7THA0_PLEWA|nr:hypothetical protein NDU88_001253 [Pleurodeles waltl]
MNGNETYPNVGKSLTLSHVTFVFAGNCLVIYWLPWIPDSSFLEDNKSDRRGSASLSFSACLPCCRENLAATSLNINKPDRCGSASFRFSVCLPCLNNSTPQWKRSARVLQHVSATFKLSQNAPKCPSSSLTRGEHAALESVALIRRAASTRSTMNTALHHRVNVVLEFEFLLFNTYPLYLLLA